MATRESKTKKKTVEKPVEKQVEKKQSEKRDSEKAEKKEEHSNKATRRAKLPFNVNHGRKWLVKQFGLQEDLEMPNFNGGQVAFTASLAALLSNLFKKTMELSQKDVSGLYKLNEDNLIRAVERDKHLRHLLNNFMETFDSEVVHESSTFVTKFELNSFVTDKFGENVSLDTSGHNLVSFLLGKFSSLVANTALKVMKVSTLKSLSSKFVRTAVDIHCDKELSHLLCQKVDDAMANYGKDDGDDSETKPNEKKSEESKKSKSKKGESDDDESDDEDKDKKKSKSKKGESDDDESDDEDKDKKKSKSKKEESEDESENEDKKKSKGRKNTKSKKEESGDETENEDKKKSKGKNKLKNVKEGSENESESEVETKKNKKKSKAKHSSDNESGADASESENESDGEKQANRNA